MTTLFRIGYTNLKTIYKKYKYLMRFLPLLKRLPPLRYSLPIHYILVLPVKW